MSFPYEPPSPDVELEITQPEEIARLLGRLRDSRGLVTAHAPGGAPLLLSAILHVDAGAGEIWLDTSADAETNRRALLYPQLRCIGQLDHVGVRFTLLAPALADLDGMPAFRAALPLQLLYLQRREYYRLRVPLSMAVVCRLPVEAEPAPRAGAPAHCDVRVVDLSAGGVLLRVPDGFQGSFAPGTRIGPCRLIIPETEVDGIELQVRHLTEHRRDEGAGSWYAGCEFRKPSGRAQNLIQRFVMRVDRELVARARGMS